MSLQLPVVIIIIVCIAACNDAPKDKPALVETPLYEKLDSTQWLLGSWFNSSKEGDATETWEKVDDSTLSAESFVVAGKDTVFYEQVKLEQRNNSLYYVAKTRGQNDNEAVSFKLVSENAEALVFENPQHDFPTKITYTKIGSDSLFAEISGQAKGQEKRWGFRLRRQTQFNNSC
uniref:DUF6265 family protein n=1 Tax=Niabella hibiscisoli TaxID=1825928 RepID=UPI00374D3630